jgi:hypothetical protein
MAANSLGVIITLRAQIMLLRAGSHHRPIEVRAHPMDIGELSSAFLPDAPSNRIEGFAIFGCPLIPDEALERGLPIADYSR